jgi:protein phosphatase
MDCFGLTHVGKVREANEDQFLIADLDKSMRVLQSSLDHQAESELAGNSQGRLLVVADGMGGHASGERASSIAVDTLSNYVLDCVRWFCRLGEGYDDEFLEELKCALKQCQSRILAEVEIEPGCNGMGTTVTMAYVAWPKFYLAHVGDSRCYWLHRSKLRQITRDHTVAQQCVENGTMTPETAKTSWLGNALWNVVGGPSDTLEPEVYKSRLKSGDSLLLCSDGLNKHVPDDVIRAVLNDHIDAQEACRRLVGLANDAGGTDNVTVIVARFLPDPDELDDDSDDSVLDEPIEKSLDEMDTLPLEDCATLPDLPEREVIKR